jgi:hypothetical protein
MPAKKKPTMTSGVCRVCGCTDGAACPEGCAWVPMTSRTLCTACLDRRWRLALYRRGGGIALIDKRSGYRRHYLTDREAVAAAVDLTR